MKYEYMFILNEHDTDSEARVTLFNQLGEMGWELISPPNHSAWYFKRHKSLLPFKRHKSLLPCRKAKSPGRTVSHQGLV